MYRQVFEDNKLADALLKAGAWLARQSDEIVNSVTDTVVHELYADGFGSWEVVIYYEKRT